MNPIVEDALMTHEIYNLKHLQASRGENWNEPHFYASAASLSLSTTNMMGKSWLWRNNLHSVPSLSGYDPGDESSMLHVRPFLPSASLVSIRITPLIAEYLQKSKVILA